MTLLKAPTAILIVALSCGAAGIVSAQQSATAPLNQTAKSLTDVFASSSSENKSNGLTERERMLLDRIEQLEGRLAEVESRLPNRTEAVNTTLLRDYVWSGRTLKTGNAR